MADASFRWIGLPQRGLLLLVRGYRLILSPWLGSSCRFEPTCSVYALEALERHGAAAGSYLAGARVLRCHPWCDGGFDPVPHRPPALFRRFVNETAPSTPSSDKTP
jgi:putative membrane protein insertion efficiency factor